METAEENGSVRTCVGGGGAKSKTELERFVYDERVGLIFDVRQKAPGRGVWVTPTPEHLQKAISGGFARGFKKKVVLPDLATLVADMKVGIRQRFVERLRVAIRSGKAIVGGSAVEEGMRNDRVALLVVAEDAGESTRKKFLSNADRKNLPVIPKGLRGGELAVFCGGNFLAVLGIEEPSAASLERDWRCLEALEAFEG